MDQCCRVLVNDRPVGSHQGGYLPFTLDITGALVPGENRLTAAVTDDPDGGVHAFGKQRRNRGGIWYTAQSGIWQTVWLESVAENYIHSLWLTPDYDEKALRYAVRADDPAGARITVLCGGQVIARSWADEKGLGVCPIPAEHFRPWSPEDPYLYDLEVTLPSGDRVESYFGMRKFSVMEHQGRRVLALNDQPCFQSGLLDQGYWSDGLYTPPADEAMVWDIQTARDMGFNMLRKHIKIEPLRWYYHCDRLGIIVWQDLVSCFERWQTLTMQVLPFLGLHLHDAPSARLGRAGEAGRRQFLRTWRTRWTCCITACAWACGCPSTRLGPVRCPGRHGPAADSGPHPAHRPRLRLARPGRRRPEKPPCVLPPRAPAGGRTAGAGPDGIRGLQPAMPGTPGLGQKIRLPHV